MTPIDQYRENRRRYLTDKAISVLPYWERARHALDIAQEWGRLAVRAAFILNGGALFLLPAVLKSGNEEGLFSTDTLLVSATWFVVGLSAAFVTATLAYFNGLRLADSFYADGQAEQAKAISLHFRIDWPTEALEKIKVEESKANFDVALTQYIAIASAFSAFLCFAIGSFRLL